MDRPILFSAPMVRALLSGAKTQTRRVLKPQPLWEDAGHTPAGFSYGAGWSWGGLSCWADATAFGKQAENFVRIQTGDRLWVREACCVHGDEVFYRANEPRVTVGLGGFAKWRPSIHMPRWASRLMLTVTDVRVQRLQDISEEDAQAEGCDEGSLCVPVFCALWKSINGAESWDANPWVAAYTFTVERRNIDAPALPMSEGR
jgi:hypothetical protein